MKKTVKTYDTYIIIFFVLIAASISTYFIPRGLFDTKSITYVQAGKEKTKLVLIPETFRFERDKEGVPVKKGVKLFESSDGKIGFLNYMFEGLVSGDKWSGAVGIIAFILIIGGAFGIIIRTGAVEAALFATIRKVRGFEFLIIAIMFFLFSLGGAIFGMGEEALPFLMLLIPIFIAMGYDSITAIMVVYTATVMGFATSWMNPFSVAIAQGIAGVPVLSGAVFRILMWIFFTTLGLVYTLLYARKVKKNPKKSIAYETDKTMDLTTHDPHQLQAHKFLTGHALVLITLGVGMMWVLWGVIFEGYYIPEMASQFFVIGLVSGIIGAIFKLSDMTWGTIPESFRHGAQALLGAALVIGMAKGILLILGGNSPTEPTVLNTLLSYTGSAISSFPSYLSAWFMYVFQAIFNFFVPSGSGQAALTMPLMAPIADIANVSRQVAVLAFQLGDGFTNLIVPTSAILMGILGIANLDWVKWLKFQIKFQLVLFAFGSLFVIGAVLLNFN